MRIAPEGLREIALATLILGACAALAAWLIDPFTASGALGAAPFFIAWVWVLSFFRDPTRTRVFQPAELCAPADGTITEITELDHHDSFDGPVVRIGIFLSLLNVHINRSPCSGVVRSIVYREGEYLDARHPESGRRNEANTLLIDPDSPMPGPIQVRQVAGLVARRIICHAKPSDHMSIGARFGLIKFGSRTELVIPRCDRTEIRVKLGDKVRAGLTVMARQPASPSARGADETPDPIDEAARGSGPSGETAAIPATSAPTSRTS